MTDTALIDAETARTRLPRNIVAALLHRGLEVPTREMVDRIGYSAAQVAAILPTVSSAEGS